MTMASEQTNLSSPFPLFQQKMQDAGLSKSAMDAFEHSYSALFAGQSGLIAEMDLTPASELPHLEGAKNGQSIRQQVQANAALLKETVVLKLNGGLGTSMGLDKAKSLLPVRGEDTFLDLMAKQIMDLRERYASNVRFVLMNSFSTSQDTLQYLQKYPSLIQDAELELMQNKVPKVDASTMKPAEWPTNPDKEWCPPGHGDLYASLAGSGKLDALLKQGIKYMFVSNSDNLGATLDLDLLTYFAESGKPFLMECCERTANDKKGGHLAVRKSDEQLILRESAQCASEDTESFQDITRHRYFNTNNLWIRLDRLAEAIAKHGVIRLPMIKNSKTVDPKDATSTKVFQLETAMGAAIECFPGAGAVCVPRTRFAPVKKCDDLIMLRSDAYTVTADHRPVLAAKKAPIISLDSKHFKLVQQLEGALLGNVPSMVGCTRFQVKGPVVFAAGVVFKGEISIVNDSEEIKTVLPGTYSDMKINLTEQVGHGPLKKYTVKTQPIEGQKPGTSGLRKKTKTFMEGAYLNNFVQACLDALPMKDRRNGTMVVSGDGRYFNKEAIQVLVKMLVAAGIGNIWIGQNGLLSTPAVSAVIRNRNGGFKPLGGFILSASHNPGGPDEDFGIKYNCENGGPAPEVITNAIFQNTKTIRSYQIASDFPNVDIETIGVQRIEAADKSRVVEVEVFDCAEDHVELLKTIFDFPAIKELISRPDFSLVYDSMHGVQGPYAKRVLVDELGAPESCLINGIPKEDFNKGHADPNLTYAKDLTKAMGVDPTGQPVTGQSTEPPAFGAAADGDADRNMILGSRFFVTPSDSLAIIAANSSVIPFFKNGLKSVARSMPTSGAVDLVAKANNLNLFEVPTGWKFFGNLMDSAVAYGKEEYTPLICGEESFGTGSNHIREKDGMWAVLAWLQILASRNVAGQPLVTVEQIVREHWATYGRNYYCRYDYEGVDKPASQEMMAYMAKLTVETASQTDLKGFTLRTVDEFTYTDPVDGSISAHQGIRFIFTDNSRIIFRLSGTGVAGATIRMYIEKYEASTGILNQKTADALGPLIEVGLALSKLQAYVHRDAPTVIT